MKKTMIHLMIGLFCCIVSSCDKFLSEEPDNRLSIQNLDEASQLLVQAYPASYLFLEWMTDNVGPVPSHIQDLAISKCYTWANITEEDQDTPNFFWSETYYAIAHANQVLAVLDQLPGDPLRKRAIEAEARLCRAFGHFMLVNIFAKHYDAATATTDPGIPYVSKPEEQLLVSYKRHSVQDVYDFIEEDLTVGLEYVKNADFKYPIYHFNRNAALAFASRFYLFQKDYEQCARYAMELLGETGFTPTYIKDYMKVITGQGPTGQAQVFSNSDDASNIMLVRTDMGYQLYPSVGYRFTIDIYNEFMQYSFGEDDLRMFGAYATDGTKQGLTLCKQEYLFKRQSLTSNVGVPYTIQPVFRGEEVFYNLMEAWIYQQKYAEVTGAMEQYVTTRYPNYKFQQILDMYVEVIAKDKTKQEQWLQLLLDERRKEYIEEGLRWFDIKRYRIPVTHLDVEGSLHTLTDQKMIIEIPVNAIVNGLEPNHGVTSKEWPSQKVSLEKIKSKN